MSEKFTLIEVGDKSSIKEFSKLPVRIYKNEQNWIRPLDSDIEKIFNPKENKYFRHGEAIRWILKNENGATVGRVAAFIDRKASKKYEQPTGGLGFFECVDDKEAAFFLFDTCKKWLQDKGMEAMDGPINFGDRNEWWGLLVEGFYEPNYAMHYHHKYYKKFFENYGFQIYFKQYTYHRSMDKSEGLSEVIIRKAERIKRNPDYSFRHAQKNDLENFMEDFRVIYNKGWAKFAGVREMTTLQAKAVLKKIKPLIDVQLLWIGYHKEDPVVMFFMFPDLNQLVKTLNGKMNLFGKLKFVYYKKFGGFNKVIGTIFGVVPEHQGKGLEGAVVMAFADVVGKNYKYNKLELNWIGDWNPKMMKVAESIGAKIKKTHHTYRLLFDANKEFKRMPAV